ncbi:membrane protein [Halobacillus karajensis]|uniref:YihY family inner membrane protein n=1 Tax=Halobacillus karajensis TaxID=195088 RepID=A0A024P6U4_9BACI|nr:YihY/virulence factor BrkB family protein [Halobacillus karajensis]CDQ20469.1 ribonuclease BN/unknown domain fusion protein [Halobacillus karajensis]CDQ24062.1 ribonuclease BN/unknown domain fusion protein [Halobacillus karajensis]CDQ27540.1 ribonuclease BN/unknown domain fusion protein [Halobacillus karajensis]SEH91240.1 membrane protein [Halobacillus karajensis]
MTIIKNFGKELFTRFGEDDVGGMAAQLAYFFLLSLFPFMIFLLTLLGYLHIDEERVLAFVSAYAPPNTFDMITENVSSLLRSESGSLLSFGLIGTLWAASNGVNAIMRAFNRAHNVEENRSFIVSRLIAIVLTVAMVIVIGIAFLLPILGHSIGVHLFSFFGLSDNFLTLWNGFRWVISSIIFFIVLSFLYVTAPNKRLKYRDTVPGALFATFGWQLVSLLFSFYVSNLGNFSATYGSLGGVIVLMIWFYISGMVIILGGEINAMSHHRRTKNTWG